MHNSKIILTFAYTNLKQETLWKEHYFYQLRIGRIGLRGEVKCGGSSRQVVSFGDTETPTEYPCLVVDCENEDNGWGITCYDFIYKSDVEKLFCRIK